MLASRAIYKHSTTGDLSREHPFYRGHSHLTDEPTNPCIKYATAKTLPIPPLSVYREPYKQMSLFRRYIGHILDRWEADSGPSGEHCPRYKMHLFRQELLEYHPTSTKVCIECEFGNQAWDGDKVGIDHLR